MTVQQLRTMLEMQNDLNKTIAANWLDLDLEWYRAVYTEAVELLNELNWEWWKEMKDADITAVHLELVDIWHFIMSWVLQRSEGNIDDAIKYIVQDLQFSIEASESHYNHVLMTEEFINTSMQNNDVPIVEFFVLADVFELSDDCLFKLYTGKNELNRFRQKYGYKTGEYQKVWANDKSDNQNLYDLIISGAAATEQEFLKLYNN